MELKFKNLVHKINFPLWETGPTTFWREQEGWTGQEDFCLH